jgi:purine-binding chemotaxis protein CheW
MSATPVIVTPTVATRAAELRLAFDRAFAEPMQLEPDARELVLSVRVGGQVLAIRRSEINALHVDKKITPVPGGHAGLLGIAGFRGAIVPVYDLRHLLLGHPGGELPRWLVIAAATPVALAFDAFEQQFRIPRGAIMPQAAGSQLRGYAREFVRSRKFAGPMLHVPSVLEAIDREAGR